MVLMSLAAFACNRPPHAAADLPAPNEDLPAPAPSGSDDGQTQQKAVFAAGCFWCVETVFEHLEGVSAVVSGYAGGSAETANYEQVSAGRTAHAEVVEVTYDPASISYGQLLRVFFATHDPTTKDRQGPDWGAQYRSAIFYADADQERVARAYIDQLNEAKVFDAPIVTTLESLGATGGFFPAEPYHQDFVARNPRHPYVQAWVPAKYEKLTRQFGDLLDETPSLDP